MKECKKCKQSKALTEFHKTDIYEWQKDGHDYYCKYCRIGACIDSQKNNKRKCSLDECDRPHYAKNYCRMHYTRWTRNGTLEAMRAPVNVAKVYYYQGTKIVYEKHYALLAKYKMTLEEFESRSVNGCELCGEKTERSLHVDHDHKCCNTRRTCGNCTRGIVCNKCNTAIDKYENNKLRDDYPLKDKIIKYLEEYKNV